ncbi:MAG TPA: outer membrane lipoprotein carrier protein LolA [Labilithrix sp.]
MRRAALLATAIAIATATATASATPTPTPTPTETATAPRDALDDAKLDALLADIAKARATVKTLRADFVQERRLALFATSVKSTGKLVFVAPERLRWELAPPDDVVYWIGPEGLSYRTRSSGATVPATNVGRALADLRALLGGDLGKLRERYVLSATRGASDVAIDGTAKDKAASVRAFTLVLDKALVLPLRAKLVEGKADTIDVVFSNAVVNAPVDAAIMKP